MGTSGRTCNNEKVPTTTSQVKKAARQMATLLQKQMDNAGLTVAQRERNVRVLEKAGAKIGAARGKAAGATGTLQRSNRVATR